MDKSVANIVREVQAGDEEAFTRLYQCIYMDVYKMAFSICRDHNDANDILQETFFVILKTIQNVKDPNAFSIWVKRVVMSCSCRHFRKNKFIAIDDEQAETLRSSREYRKEYLSKENYDELSERELIHIFVSQLSQKHQEVIDCIYFQQLSLKETAVRLKRPVGTIKSQLFFARTKLQSMIQEYEIVNDRKVRFYDFSTSFVMGVGAAWFYKLKYKLSNYSKPILNVATVTSIMSVVTVSMIGVRGVIANTKSLSNDNSQLPLQTAKARNADDFSVYFQGEEYTNAQDAYFAIMRYVGSPEIVTKKSDKEQREIVNILTALKQTSNAYWSRLYMDGWSIFLK